MSDAPATTGPDRQVRNPLAWLLIGLVRLWQVTGAVRQPRCKFYPSCSAYAVGSLRRHGLVRGGWLAVKRLGRCHPWSLGGVDHVPDELSRPRVARTNDQGLDA